MPTSPSALIFSVLVVAVISLSWGVDAAVLPPPSKSGSILSARAVEAVPSRGGEKRGKLSALSTPAPVLQVAEAAAENKSVRPCVRVSGGLAERATKVKCRLARLDSPEGKRDLLDGAG